MNKIHKKWKKWIAFSDKLTKWMIPLPAPTALDMGGTEGSIPDEAVGELWLVLQQGNIDFKVSGERKWKRGYHPPKCQCPDCINDSVSTTT